MGLTDFVNTLIIAPERKTERPTAPSRPAECVRAGFGEEPREKDAAQANSEPKALGAPGSESQGEGIGQSPTTQTRKGNETKAEDAILSP